MKIRDEFRCRRCGKVFLERNPVDLSDGETTESRILNLLARMAPTDEYMTFTHECAFGGVGIGDWIGASEAKEASNASDSSD